MRRRPSSPAQLAPVLVRIDVIGVIRPRAVVAEMAERACPRAPCWRSLGTLPSAWRAALLSSASRSRGFITRRPSLSSQRRALADDERLAADRGEVVLGHVVAERVEELRGDDLGAARHLRVRRRIELDEVKLPGAVAHGEAWRDPFHLSRDDRPCPDGPALVSGPLTSRSTVHASRPMRFVNQLESGTSSIVFTLTARLSVWSPASKNEFSRKS